MRSCKKRGRSRTSARQALVKTAAAGGNATDCAGVGVRAIRAGGFLPVQAAGGYKTVACACTFAAAKLAPSMTLKS